MLTFRPDTNNPERYPPPGPLPETGRGNELRISLGEKPLPSSGRGWGGYLKMGYIRDVIKRLYTGTRHAFSSLQKPNLIPHSAVSLHRNQLKYDAMKNKRTYYQLILDRSGSMSVCIEETVSGVNSQIKRIRELASRFPEQDLITSMSLFNHQLTPVWDRIRPADLREITFSDYRPDGNTALLDAIGKTIRHLQKTIGGEVARDEASVIVVIFTDGYENASSEFSHSQVASLIRELELTDKWSFS